MRQSRYSVRVVYPGGDSVDSFFKKRAEAVAAFKRMRQTSRHNGLGGTHIEMVQIMDHFTFPSSAPSHTARTKRSRATNA